MAGVVTNHRGSASGRARRAISSGRGRRRVRAASDGGPGRHTRPRPPRRPKPARPLPPASPPTVPRPTRFTMLIRINTQGNVNTWTQFNTDPTHEGLAPFVRPQDIFVLNTRFTGSGQFPAMTDPVAAGLGVLAARHLPLQPDHRPQRHELRPDSGRLRLHGDRRPERLRPDDRLRAGRLEQPAERRIPRGRPGRASSRRRSRGSRAGTWSRVDRRRQPGRGRKAHRPGAAGRRRLELRAGRAGPQQEELATRLPQARATQRADPGRLRRRRRRRLRGPSQGNCASNTASSSSPRRSRSRARRRSGRRRSACR